MAVALRAPLALQQVGTRVGMAVGRQPLLELSVLLVGLVLRLGHLPFVDLGRPFEKGGLYAQFAEDLANNSFLVPRRVRFYSDGGLPFAYPPLSFYVEGFLIETLSLPKFLVANLLPPTVSILALVCFWVLLGQLRLRTSVRVVALLAFATLPAAYAEQLPADGLAEAFGSLALVVLAVALTRVWRRGRVVDYAVLGVAWAGCVVASPGSAYASVPTVVSFAAVQVVRCGLRGAFRAACCFVMTGLLALALSSPYWWPVIGNHGFDIFTTAARSQNAENRLGYSVARILSGRAFLLADDVASQVWAVLMLLGFVASLARRWFGPAIWFLLLASIPREGAWMAAVPGALLCGMSAELPHLGRQALSGKGGLAAVARGLQPAYWVGVAVGLAVVGISTLEAMAARNELAAEQVPSSALAGMEWVRENTPRSADFVVYGSGNIKEWFPNVTKRTEINTRFGAEWDPKKLEKINRLDEKLQRCRDLACVGRETEALGYKEIYVFGARPHSDRLADLVEPGGAGRAGGAARSEGVELLWGREGIAVARLRMR